jgi:hypothetical protein
VKEGNVKKVAAAALLLTASGKQWADADVTN